MLKRLISILGLLMLLLSFGAAPDVKAQVTTNNRGIDINNNIAHDGLHAYVSTGVGTVNGNEYNLYAMNPDRYQVIFSSQIHPSNSCLQAEVFHERPSGGSTSHFFHVYDWCGGVNPAYKINLKTDATFRGKYVRTLNWNDTGTAFSDEMIELRVIQTYAPTNQWGVYAWNFNTSAYDLLVQRSGSSVHYIGDGYLMWGDGGGTQTAPNPYCPPLNPSFVQQIRGIQLRNAGVWANLTNTQYSLHADVMYCFNTSLLYHVVQPAPQIFKVRASHVNI